MQHKGVNYDNDIMIETKVKINNKERKKSDYNINI